jgi:hypothetical protein
MCWWYEGKNTIYILRGFDFQSFKLGQREILCFCQTSSLGIIKETLNYNKG